MTEFGYILIIIFEIITASFIVVFLYEAEKNIKTKMSSAIKDGEELTEKLKTYKNDLKSINERLSFIKKIDLCSISKNISSAVEIINFILLIRSLNLQKGGFKLIKVLKLIPYSLIQRLIAPFKSCR